MKKFWIRVEANECEFYWRILEKILLSSGIQTQELLGEMMRERCCRALEDIRAVLDDDTLDDPSCFQRIERIVTVYEALGAGGGSRHDF